MTTPSAPPPPAGLPPLKALLVLLALIIIIGSYIAIASALGTGSIFAGFLFALYWTGLKDARQEEFLPAALGAIGGVAMAWLMHALGAVPGVAGQLTVLGVALVAVYCLLAGLFPVVINLCFMLFLTVATIPVVATQADFSGMIIATLLAMAYVWIPLRLLRAKAARASA